MLTATKNAIIVEALENGERLPVYNHEKVISLNDISIYTDDNDVPLRDVFTKLYEKQNGKPASIDIKKADKKALHDFLSLALPNFDKDRVHNSDIIKIIKWYNILVDAGFTSFEEDKEQPSVEKNEQEESSKEAEKQGETVETPASKKGKVAKTKK